MAAKKTRAFQTWESDEEDVRDMSRSIEEWKAFLSEMIDD